MFWPILNYLRYILIHKWYVMIECFKRGLYIQGITHDMSKFMPCEFFPYMNWFYNKNNFKDENLKTGQKPYIFIDSGMGKLFFKSKQDLKKEFDLAWLHHIHYNPHHWQFWMLYEEGDETGIKLFEMPEKYVKEMVADWIGAGIAITGKREFKQWYEKNKDKIILHENTRSKVENYLAEWR